MYAASDAYISLHRAEGFGLNLAETMLLGKPLIATNWSGNLDFMDRNCAVLINADLVSVNDPDKVYSKQFGQWAEPRMDEAVRWLRRLAKEPDLLTRLSSAAKVAARERLSGGSAAILLQKDHSKGA
jgi:glycosyltransferase involved in cell wall biosynthesis